MPLAAFASGVLSRGVLRVDGAAELGVADSPSKRTLGVALNLPPEWGMWTVKDWFCCGRRATGFGVAAERGGPTAEEDVAPLLEDIVGVEGTVIGVVRVGFRAESNAGAGVCGVEGLTFSLLA